MIRIYKTKESIILERNSIFYLSDISDWDECINQQNLYQYLVKKIGSLEIAGDENWFQSQKMVAPIGLQEVWAAGVTYLRSKVARMEESSESGGASFYDKVYEADRPELFFKSLPQKVVGPNEFVRTRKDSTWDVPEPELTLVINSAGDIVGYTAGNDMSSRSIEGENPLYLPQAKMYDKSCAIGPCVLVLEDSISRTTGISMIVERNNEIMFEGSTTIDQMKRSHQELVGYLYRESSFPNGCYLMTGTCVVPGNNFTLQSGDRIIITIEHIGKLVNVVE